jgi:leader peptidase (prepilin peptidase)/N-methyltransferase
MMVLLVAIAFIDLEHRIIPDRLSIPGLVLALVTSFFDPTLGFVSSFSGALLGFSFFWAMAWIYEKQTGQSGMGGGDIKLMAMLGAYVGPVGVLYTVFISSVFGSVAGIFWSIHLKNKNLMKTSIPYGPFLVVGALAYCLVSGLIRVDL